MILNCVFQNDVPGMLAYSLKLCMSLMQNKQFRNKVLRVLVKIYMNLEKPDFINVCQVLLHHLTPCYTTAPLHVTAQSSSFVMLSCYDGFIQVTQLMATHPVRIRYIIATIYYLYLYIFFIQFDIIYGLITQNTTKHWVYFISFNFSVPLKIFKQYRKHEIKPDFFPSLLLGLSRKMMVHVLPNLLHIQVYCTLLCVSAAFTDWRYAWFALKQLIYFIYFYILLKSIAFYFIFSVVNMIIYV